MNGSMVLQVCLVDSSLTRAQRLAAQISRLEFHLSPDVRATGVSSGLLGRRQFSTVTFTTEVVSRLEMVGCGESVASATTMVVWYGDRPDIGGLLAKMYGQPVCSDCVVMFNYPASPDCARPEKVSEGCFGGAPLKESLYSAACQIFKWLFRPLCFVSRNVMYFMSPDDIRYIESKGRLLRVHGSVNVTSYLTLGRVAAALPSTFIHCHKSYLVNSDYVRAFTGDRLILLSGESIPVSQRRASLTRVALEQYAKQM